MTLDSRSRWLALLIVCLGDLMSDPDGNAWAAQQLLARDEGTS